MEQKYINMLMNPDVYDERTTSVHLVQTHVSLLFITDHQVFKVKKPVDFGFLNFSTLDRRRFYCEEEVRLNRRLCPDVYLGVSEIRETDSGVSFHGTGTVVDYAVRMKRLPAARMLDRLLEEGGMDQGEIREIARTIGRFHLRAERSEDIDRYGITDVIRLNWDENFRQITDFVPLTLAGNDLDLLRDWVERYIEHHAALFDSRVEGGFIRDCDGDIHSENICLSDRVYIFDCIEFNPRFRYSDTAADIAFLLMDMEYRGRRDLAEVLLDEYLSVTGDHGMLGVLDFYLVYRAFVRGKVESFRLRDPGIPVGEKEQAAERARKHFLLARGYILRRKLQPSVIIFSGLMGAGKSTLSRELSFQLGIDRLNSDSVRKELAGISGTEHRFDTYCRGIYSEEFSRATYIEMLRRAEKSLRNGRSIIIDATFGRREERERFASLARMMGVPFRLFNAVCPEADILQRLRSREGDHSEISDGRLELFARHRDDFEPFSPGEERVDIETNTPVYDGINHVLRALGATRIV